jgi:hypothetical protein
VRSKEKSEYLSATLTDKGPKFVVPTGIVIVAAPKAGAAINNRASKSIFMAREV